MSNPPPPPSSLAATVVLHQNNPVGQALPAAEPNLPLPVVSNPPSSALYAPLPGAANNRGLMGGSVRESEGVDLLASLAERERAVAARELAMQQWERSHKEREEKIGVNLPVNSEGKEESIARPVQFAESNLPLIFSFSPAAPTNLPVPFPGPMPPPGPVPPPSPGPDGGSGGPGGGGGGPPGPGPARSNSNASDGSSRSGSSSSSTFNNTRAKINPPRTYTGFESTDASSTLEKETILEWIQYLERYMAVMSVPITQQAEYALFYLGGPALTYMTGLLAGSSGSANEIDHGSWAWMKRHLIKQYQPWNLEQTVRDSLSRCVQREDEDVNTFIQRFLRLAGQLRSLTEEERLGYFRRGLLPVLMEKVDLLDGTGDGMNWRRAVNIVVRAEASFRAKLTRMRERSAKRAAKRTVGQFTSSSQVAGLLPSTQPRSELSYLRSSADEGSDDDDEDGDDLLSAMNVNVGRGSGPSSRPRPQMSSTEKTKLYSEGKCFFCKKEGHIAKNCPNRQQRGQGSTSNQQGKVSAHRRQ
jgi:hypothetical protein